MGRHTVLPASTLHYSDKLNGIGNHRCAARRGNAPPDQKECHAHISVSPVTVYVSVCSIAAVVH